MRVSDQKYATEGIDMFLIRSSTDKNWSKLNYTL